MDVLCACIYMYCVCELPENSRRGEWICFFVFVFKLCVHVEVRKNSAFCPWMATMFISSSHLTSPYNFLTLIGFWDKICL